MTLWPQVLRKPDLTGCLARWSGVLVLTLAAVCTPATRPAAQPTEAAPQTFYTLTVEIGRVRKAPHTGAEILFRLRRGAIVAATEREGDWLFVDTPDGRSGWAHQRLFRPTAVPADPVPAPLTVIRGIRTETVSDREVRVFFELDSHFPPRTFVLDGPQPRLVCDFLDARLSGGLGHRHEIDSPLIQDIRIALHPGLSPKVRVVIDLYPGRTYAIDPVLYKKEKLFTLTLTSER